MTRKATLPACHLLPSPGSPACVRVPQAGTGRGAGWLAVQAPRPFLSSGQGEKLVRCLLL